MRRYSSLILAWYLANNFCTPSEVGSLGYSMNSDSLIYTLSSTLDIKLYIRLFRNLSQNRGLVFIKIRLLDESERQILHICKLKS